jgi:hypothetical protein
MAKLPIDDIFKAIAKQLANKGNQKARYELMKKTKGIATKGVSNIKAKPKVRPTVSGKPVGKIAKTTPPRPKRDYYPKGKTVAQNDAERRAAEKLANRMLRQAGDTKPKPKLTGNTKPIGVKGSVIKPPSKATMRSPKPKSSSYEADKFNAAVKADRDAFRGGQKPPRGKGGPKKGGGASGAGGIKVKPKPKKPSGSGGATATAKRLKSELDNATTPAARLAARNKLMKHILATGSRRSTNIYK